MGMARYLQVVIERGSQSAQVVLVVNAESPEPITPCLDMIRERLGAELHSLWFNSNTGRGNTILGPSFRRWAGADSVSERFGGAAIHYPPGAFGQSNLQIAEQIIRHIRSLIRPDARVVEFYAGVGAIGLSLLDLTTSLVLNEANAASLRGLQMGIDALGAVDQAKITVAPGLAQEAVSVINATDVVIADPPRKGLDANLLQHLCVRPPKRFIYVSCGWQTFVKDAQMLIGGRSHALNLNAGIRSTALHGAR